MHSAVWPMYHAHVAQLACSDDSWVKGGRKTYSCYFAHIHDYPSLTVSSCNADFQTKKQKYLARKARTQRNNWKSSRQRGCHTNWQVDRQGKTQPVCQVSREAMRWTKKQVGAQAIEQLESQSDRQSEQAVRQRCRQIGERGDWCTQATTKHTKDASVKQTRIQTQCSVLMWEAKWAALYSQGGGLHLWCCGVEVRCLATGCFWSTVEVEC